MWKEQTQTRLPLVTQTAESAVSQGANLRTVRQPNVREGSERARSMDARPTGTSAIRQVGKPALLYYRSPIAVFIVLCLSCILRHCGTALAAEENDFKSAREFYNEGTRHLRTGKLREAETALQASVATNEEKVQPTALFNLGYVRFQQGAAALKEAPNGDTARASSDAASETANKAIQSADDALAGEELSAIVRAYMQGRGALKQLKPATEAVRRAMEAYRAVLSRWQRASGDFKSAYELRPKQEDARFNAQVVDQHIAALVDRQAMMQMAAMRAGEKRQELRQRMEALKQRMPEGLKKELAGDEEEEEEDQPPKEPKAGQKELLPKEGREMGITPEEAMRLLQSLQLDKNRKLPMGAEDTDKPKDRQGRDW